MATVWSATNKNSSVLLSNGGLTAAADPGGVAFTYIAGRSDTGFTDKRFWSLKWDVVVPGDGASGLGVSSAALTLTNGSYLGKDGHGAAYYDDGGIQLNGASYFATISQPAQGDTIDIACDAAAGKIWFRRNGGLWNDSATDDPADRHRRLQRGLSRHDDLSGVQRVPVERCIEDDCQLRGDELYIRAAERLQRPRQCAHWRHDHDARRVYHSRVE